MLEIKEMPKGWDYLYEVEFKGTIYRFYSYLAADRFVAEKLKEITCQT